MNVKRPFESVALSAGAAISFAFSAVAATVSHDAATAAAEGFLRPGNVGARLLPERTVASATARGGLWIVALEPSGYVVMAGSDKCRPVLAFSTDDFAEPEAGSPLDVILRDNSAWVEKTEADESADVDALWAKLTATASKKALAPKAAPTGTDGTGYDAFVAPLLGAKWHQNEPYNDLSPYNYFCGCMATAAGQELRYWRWPYRYEKSRQTTHGVRDAQNNYSNFVLRPDGRVPFDWDKVLASYPAPATTPKAADKVATYNAAFLSLWMQSMTGMGYKPGGSGGTRQLASEAEDYWYEHGKVMTYWNDGYTNLWNAVKADLDWGSPIQINTAAHQMVIDGYAIENKGAADEVDYINLNLGYGNAIFWTDLKTAVTSGTYSGVLAAFQTGYRPQKIVQFEPVPKVITNGTTIAWHIAPCYTNKTSSFLVQTAKDGDLVGSGVVIASGDERNTYEATGLENGCNYTFTVTPVMSDASSARANSVSAVVGTPEPAPEILSVSSVACGIELVQQDIFVECARGITNKIAVACSESVTSLAAYSSHLTILPDNKIGVAKEGSVFTVNVDACDMAQRWNVEGEMLVLTLVAANADGTETAKNLMLRFNSMRNVLGGTFDVVDTAANSAVWFANGTTTTIDAKGQNVTFGTGAVNGTGTIVLADSVGGGSFTFAGLNGFSGTLKWGPALTVNLPADMTGFSGTIHLESAGSNYSLSANLPSTAKLHIGANTALNLVNATVNAALSGSGIISIASGTSSLNNMNGFTGSIDIGTFDSAAYLTVNAGEEKNVSIWNGTLYLTLSDAQVAYGYTTSEIKYNWSKLVFKDTAGKVLKIWTTDDKTFVFEATANAWTPDPATNGGRFSDPARWSFGRMPLEGEYALVDATYLYGASTLTLDLSSDLHLACIKVVGEGGVANAVIEAAAGTATLHADTFENAVSTTLNADKIQLAAVVPRASLKIADGIVVDCQIDSSIATNLKNPSGVSALTSSDYWIGTVAFDNRTVDVNPAEYGNASSRLLFTGATGRLYCPETVESEVVLRDSGSSPAFHWNGGYGDLMPILEKLSGDGTLKTSNAIAETIVVKDVSEFAGSLDLAAKTIAFADEKPSSNTGGGGLLHVCKPVANAAGKTWMANGGLYLGAGGTLTVNGAFATGSGIVAYGAGTGLTIEDGASVKVNAAISGDYAPALNYKAGTYKITANVTETKPVNFCAAAGKCTTLDANGYKMTLGPDFFSGSGDVYLTSSASGGAFAIQGVSSAFTGTIYADISAGVAISGDLSQSNGKISFSDISLSVPSTSLGNVDVGPGGTLVVTVSKSGRINGLVIDSVTLVDGGALVLQDTDGKTLASFTAADAVDGKYVLAPAADVEPVCILDYEFNGNVASTGSDNNATLQSSSAITYYDSSALYTKHTPWITKEFAMPDDEWTAVVRGTLPAANSAKPTMVLMFGTNGGNIFGLVAGTGENTVALAERSGIIGNAVAVADATAKYHVYTIVKTAGRVRLYVDRELKVDEAKTISVPKKFQFGSVHGGNNSSYAACTGDDSRIDYFKFYDFAAGQEFIESLLPEEEPEPVPALAIPGTVSQEPITFTNVFLDASEEWALIGDKPIFFTVPSQTNIFTVAFDAYIPDAAGTVFGFEVTSGTVSNEIKVRRTDDGTVKGLHSGYSAMGSSDFTGGTTVLTQGTHRIMVEYDHRNSLAPESIRGTTIYVDGVNVYHSKGLSWRGRVATLFSIGGAAIANSSTDVLTGMKVKNLTFVGGTFKDQASGADSFATVNGVAAGSLEENLSLVRLFALTPANREVTFDIDGIDVTSGKLSTAVSPAVVGGSLTILAKESLADQKWTRAKVLAGEDARGGELSLRDADLSPYRFFKLRAEEGSPAKGTKVD